jgi:cytochrome c-type biogenesis protein CcmH/NrfG
MLLRAAGDADRIWFFVGTSAFVASVYVWGLALIYVPGPALLLLGACCTGLVFAAHGALDARHARTFSLIGNRGSGFILVTITMLLVVGSVATLYWVGRHYAAAYTYASGVTALAGGSLDESEQRTVEAYALAPDDRYARRIAEIQYARLIEMLNDQNPGENAQTRFQEVLSNGIQAGQIATELDSSDANNWGVLGNIYGLVVQLQVDGAYEQARTALERAQSLDPKNPARLLALARLDLATGDAQSARTRAGEAIRMKSDYENALVFLSELDIAEGNIAGAVAATEQVIALNPQNPVRHFQLGLLELSRNNTTAGVQALERAVALQRDYSNARYYLALAYDLVGRSGEAMTQLREVERLNPGNTLVAQTITALEQGENIGARLTGDAASTSVPEESQDTADEAPVGSGEAPDTPLLTPVNTVPAESDGEDEALENG